MFRLTWLFSERKKADIRHPRPRQALRNVGDELKREIEMERVMKSGFQEKRILSRDLPIRAWRSWQEEILRDRLRISECDKPPSRLHKS